MVAPSAKGCQGFKIFLRLDFLSLKKYTNFNMKYSKKIQNRVSRIEGQIGGVKKMIASNTQEDKVMIQLQAVISSLESLKVELVKKQMKESLVEDIRKSLGLSE
ncbi:MAG: metal-sensitive transcriptional regulator [Candidatus Dojkabacteria bacterium]|jgi:DNA-binding FrmR family transcriptional regulator|nr:metal-sensitive transcriptional regulator [Candidatus Dojkabacteria bacterium]